MNWVFFLIFTFIGLVGYLITSYPALAEKWKWPIKTYFVVENTNNWIRISATACIIISLLLCVIYNPWWSAFLSIAVCISIGPILIRNIKWRIQPWSYLMVIISAILLFIFFQTSLKPSQYGLMWIGYISYFWWIVKSERKKKEKHRPTNKISNESIRRVARMSLDAHAENSSPDMFQDEVSDRTYDIIRAQVSYLQKGKITMDDFIAFMYMKKEPVAHKFELLMYVYEQIIQKPIWDEKEEA